MTEINQGTNKKKMKKNKLIIENDKVEVEQIITPGVFDKNKYKENLEKIICNIYSKPVSEELTFDILDTEKEKEDKLIALKVKQRQMKRGEIWQSALGTYYQFIDLGVGHETGLDILSEPRKLIIELKNRTNTDNSSSRKSNLDKLARFKIEHPDYTCIYGNINADDEDKTLKGFNKKIIHNGIEIEHQVGYEFLRFILGDDLQEIINFVKNTIDKYT
jgi:hypothetical protein